MNKGLKITQIVLMALSIIALLFTIYWFLYVLYYFNDPSYGSELGTGLGVAFGLIFELIAGGINMVLSAIGLVLSLIIQKREQNKTNKILLILNVSFLILPILLSVILLIIV